ncbi:cysteine hydrolase family protein [Gracilibacillus phocaeensis]|uniref:cysteine hydrolase family protein n=1 Tax=Gracilibacillus phocaeensis TaxID=2042304 RepID=UPI0010301BEF|nr:cysteine hydrolase [Gracilibacillus phocaeensis]
MKHYWEWEPTFIMDPEKSALLVIDMQNGFIEEGAKLEVPMARRQLPVFEKLTSYFREQNIPIIYTSFCSDVSENFQFYKDLSPQRGLNLSSPDFDFASGNDETRIHRQITPLADELVIEKCGYDCFAETQLDQILQEKGITNLVITGTVINWCVDSTIRSAYHKHYDITIVSDAVSGYTHGGLTGEEWREAELNLFAEAFGRVISSDQLIDQLQGMFVKS